MELKEFIKETLVDIAMGVREANNEIGESENGSNELFKLRRNVSKEDVASNIEFDIALTAQKNRNDKARFIVAIAPIAGSASFLKSKKTENVHRIKFEVNVSENWR